MSATNTDVQMPDINWDLEVPVALFIYNRPETTRAVFDRIAEARPSRLYVVADGPKDDVPEDPERCRRAREVVDVDWDCEVFWNTADSNLGLKQRTVTGLDWVFDREEQIIFLEDDVVPSDSCFRFLSEMLDRYREDNRVMNVTGYNRLGTWKDDVQDYHFSYYPAVWGSGMWRRVWKQYDPEMALWDSRKVRERIRDVLADNDQFEHRKHQYQKARCGDLDSWSIPYGFMTLRNSGLSVVPSRNLVTNIGYGERATHTTRNDPEYDERFELKFPIKNNPFVAVDREYDRRVYEQKRRLTLFERLRRIPQLYKNDGAVKIFKKGIRLVR